MDKEKVRQLLNVASKSIDDALIELSIDDIIVDKDLQAALDVGGDIYLKPETQFTNPTGFTFKVPNTSIRGQQDNVLLGETGPAITIPRQYTESLVDNVFLDTDKNEVVVLIGRNDTTQVTLEEVPSNIKFSRVAVNNHKGKRGFEVNGKDVTIEDCFVYGLYDPEGLDSQGICVLNTPGNIWVEGGVFEAASENMMVGGDSMKIPNCRPTNILIENVEFTKPLAWKAANTPKVKCLFELKDGHNVIVRNCKLTNCWVSAQDGYAFTLTPRRGGSLRNVLIENCEVGNVSAIANITGIDGPFPMEPRSQITFRGGIYRTNKTDNGGRGCFALITSGPESVIVENCNIQVDGTAFILIGDSNPIDVLHVLNCTWNYPRYGIMIDGYQHGDNSRGVVKDIKVEGCTISNAATAFKTRYPNNVYVA